MAAKTGRSDTPPLWASWSPDYATGQAQIRRRYVQVPSAQSKLLERHDAWSAGRAPNVPQEVLDDVKARHARQLRPRAEPEQEQEQEPEPLSSQPLSSQPVPPANARREPLDSQPASPWGDRSSRKEPLSSQPSLSPHHSQSASPARSAKSATTTRTAYESVRPQDFPPSSSGASETELEFVPPGAITDVIEAIRPASRAPVVAALEPTPPSAQIIPCSLSERTSPARTLDAKRRRLMKGPTALFASPGPADRKHASRLVLPPANSAAAPLPLPSSSPAASSSPVSARMPAHPTELLSVPKPVEEDNSPPAGNQPRHNAATPQPTDNHGSSNPTDKLPPNGPPSQVPFTAFRVAYPDYQGSLGDFIRGVLCILQLQKDKALPEFLYDDFVRVFSGDYLHYIKALDTNQSALPAIHWYNHNVSRPLYTKGVLTRDNIHGVVLQYSVEVRAIHRKLKPSE
ncbi:hypothetical protein C8A05DRAFT_11205, partial [Staphylotrichum tortipilum]